MTLHSRKFGKKNPFQSGLFVFFSGIDSGEKSFVEKYADLQERGLQISFLNGREESDFNTLIPQIAELERQYWLLYESFSEESEDSPERLALEEQINTLLQKWDKKKKEFARKCRHLLDQIEDKYEILSASKELGIDLASVRTLISHPSGTKFNITQIVAQKNFTNQRGDYFKTLEISLQEEGSDHPVKLNLQGLKRQITENNLYADLHTINDLKNSIFTTPQKIENISEGMKFVQSEATPPEFTINGISDGNVILNTSVNPFDGSDLTTDTLPFGQFANFVNRNHYLPELPANTQAIGEVQSDTSKKVEKSTKQESLLDYDEAAGTIGEENLEEVPYKTSYWKDLKTNTKFYSIKDIIDFIKHIRENYKGNSEVLAQFRQGKLGEAMFSGDLKEHFKQGKRKKAEAAIKEGAEKKLKSKPPEELTKVLRTSGDKYELEVCFNVLSEQGFLNMWDPQIWSNIFQVAGISAVVPKDLSMDPNSIVCKKLYDEFSKAVNKIYDDPNQFSTWERRNLTNCASKVSGVKDRANRIISSVGFSTHMETLLKEHMSGKKSAPVDPHEYEAMLLFAIENGKGTIEDRLYYLMMGLTLKDKKGATVLNLERLSQINNALHSKNVVLAFLNSSIPRPPEGKEHPITRKELDAFGAAFLDKNPKDVDDKYVFKPNKAVKEFIWDTLISNPVYKELATNEVRNLQNIDPAETQYYIPLSSENLIKTTCITQGGIKIGMDGFANGFAGFSQYLKNMAQTAERAREGIVSAKTLNEKDQQKKLFNDSMRNIKECIKSYVIYEGILTDKYIEKPQSFIRLDHDTLVNRKVAGTDKNAMHYINELNGLVKSIIGAFNDRDYSRKTSAIYNPSIIDQPTKTQALRDFSAGFDNLIKDNNNLLLDQILGKNLTGIA